MSSIRRAIDGDQSGIVAVILDSWRRTYPEVLPAEYLAGPVEEDLKALWTAEHLARALVLVAERDDRIVGVAATFPDYEGGPYVDNLHVSKAVEGQGVGRALMAATARHLSKEGYERVHLTVAQANPRAIAFYERLGGEFEAAFEDNMFGNPVLAYPVIWDDLTALGRMG